MFVEDEVYRVIQTIPVDRRVLITSHDAFRYFGLSNHIEVKGLQGISTVSEYGLQDVSNMVNFIVDRKIKAVFVESSVSQKSLQAVIEGCTSKGHPIQIGGTLYSDSMGKEGTPEGTYKGMIRHNAYTIAKALR
jgi:manganese/zinc/iron transport system substrate-binding protein